jgi:hypothetical protein
VTVTATMRGKQDAIPAGEVGGLMAWAEGSGRRRAGDAVRAGKDFLGLDESQVRRYPAIARHAVLVMAALAICRRALARLPALPPGSRPLVPPAHPTHRNQ